MAINLYTQSFGSNFANASVSIQELATGKPMVLLAAATGGLISDRGITTLDGSGNLSVYLDTAITFRVVIDGFTIGTSLPIAVGGSTVVATQSFPRPADTTAYASGDLVANSTTAGSVVPMALPVARVSGGSGIVRRLRLRKTGTSLTNAQFRVHLFNAAPGAFANGDNGAFSVAGVANYIGRADITLDQAFTDGAFGSSDISFTDLQFKLTSGQLMYAVLEARAAYTPTSGEIFTLGLEVIQD